jgi:hypothetical protein
VKEQDVLYAIMRLLTVLVSKIRPRVERLELLCQKTFVAISAIKIRPHINMPVQQCQQTERIQFVSKMPARV